jgi:hypothetical protein
MNNNWENSLYDTTLKYNSLFDPETFSLSYMTSNINFDALDDTPGYSVMLFRHLFSGWTNIPMDRNLSNLAHARLLIAILPMQLTSC